MSSIAFHGLTCLFQKAKMTSMQEKISHLKPFIIGITGNIGTGKSLVRKMLRHFGALSLDADELAHAAYEEGSEGFLAIREVFGDKVIGSGGEINRQKLAEIVFEDASSLQKLESIIHPIVTAALTSIVNRPPLPIIAVEAVKLLESSLSTLCDKIWVVDTPAETLYKRLKTLRGMNEEEVNERLRNQTPLSEKSSFADQIIRNDGSVTDLWNQVTSIWNMYKEDLVPFSQAAEISSRLLFPFESHLLIPSLENASRLENRIRNKIDNYFKWMGPEKWLSGSDKTLKEDSESFFQLLTMTQTWGFLDIDNPDFLFSSEVKKFAARVCGYSGKSPEIHREFPKILEIIEDYYRLQLCDKVLFPVRGKVDALLGMGYHPLEGKNKNLETQLKAEYNLYTKELEPAHSFLDG